MAKYRPIKTQFWTDEWVSSLSAQEKLLYLYLITNPATTLCGIYRVSVRYLVFETGLTQKEVESCLKRFRADGKVAHADGWIIIKNFEKHQTKSPKILEGIKRELAEIPQHITEMRYCIDRVSMPMDKPELKLEPEPVLKPNLNSTTRSRSQAEFHEGSQELVLSKLLLKRIQEFNPKILIPDLQKWAAEVDKMLRIDRRSVEDIEALILWATQDPFWKGNILSTRKLREKFDQLWSKAVANQQSKARPHLIIN